MNGASANSCASNVTPLVNIDELHRHTGLSLSTIRRLRKAGKIPSYQPGGKGSRVTFPLNAIELASQASDSLSSPAAAPPSEAPQRLAGPTPKWMQPRVNS